MKLSIPDYILSLKPYSPGKPVEELEREYGIKNSIKLASNENPAGASPMAIAAIKNAVKKLNRYPDGRGYNLVKKISDNLHVKPSNIILGNGSDEIIGMLTRAMLCPDDEVIIPEPSFLMYDIMTRSAGAVPVHVPLKALAIDLDEIKKKITLKTRMIFICNPNNPTGTIISDNAFKSFIKSIPDNILIVVDEAYAEFVNDQRYANSIACIKEGKHVVTLRTFSKAYGLAGLRIGYGIMSEEISELLNRIRQPFNASLLAQVGACAAIDDTDFLKKTLLLVNNGLKYLYDALDSMQIKYFCTQANFFLIDVKKDADEVFKSLLRLGVIVRSMSSYGYPEYIRISVGTNSENHRFIDALKEVLSKKLPHPSSHNHKKRLLITIDGPAGAGKTTIAKMLAANIGYKYIDTGSLYRAVAYNSISLQISHDDDKELENMCRTLQLDFEYNEKGLRLLSNNTDITDSIRTPDITMFASAVSARPVIRNFLLKIQRNLGKDKGAVFEGRDMGTVVFPEADLKFYLDASVKTRAGRRYKEMPSNLDQSFEQVEKDMMIRDTNDKSRTIAPLIPADDAIIIDSTNLNKDEVVSLMLSFIFI